jgi:MFS transporter, DHA3 family, macrolide efflux protein
VGAVAGGVVVSLFYRVRRKVLTFLVTTAASFLVGDLVTALSRVPIGWAVAGFLSEFSIPFIVSPYYALWQEIVPPDVQGKVFATREMVQISSQPIGYLAGGLLADFVFEPALHAGGVLAGVFGPLVGAGPGAGMATMFLLTSILGCLTGIAGLLSKPIRELEGN